MCSRQPSTTSRGDQYGVRGRDAKAPPEPLPGRCSPFCEGRPQLTHAQESSVSRSVFLHSHGKNPASESARAGSLGHSAGNTTEEEIDMENYPVTLLTLALRNCLKTLDPLVKIRAMPNTERLANLVYLWLLRCPETHFVVLFRVVVVVVVVVVWWWWWVEGRKSGRIIRRTEGDK
ncbi:hypothetical protein E2C01_018741 [Portunus trituberculatus]|uniref:Uncharacterized protein n=1 Tax=Portunus trituberculatus TaxID=210409 RepID=A0A5B7DX10_PORTR|nr:hypothetical protein [Portunus trituberculatus]